MDVTTTLVEACIVAYGNETTIGSCIDSLRQLGDDVAVALCDNHPDGATAPLAEQVAAERGLKFRSILRPDNPGFAAACNALAAGSTAPWLLFLNPDARLVSIGPLQATDRGLRGARLLDRAGSEQHNFGRNRSLWDELARRLQVRPRRPTGTGYVSGAAMLIPADDFRSVGGFDERFFMYYEDIDLCRRLNEAGLPVSVDPEFVVEHIGGYSASAQPGTAALRSYESGRAFHRRWAGSATGFTALVVVDSATRHSLHTLHVPVPGGPGSSKVLRRAFADLRADLAERWADRPRAGR